MYGSSWKLPRNIFVEAAIDGSNGSLYFHRQWKLPCIFIEASTNFHGSESISTNFHGNSMEVNLLPPTSMEVSMEVNSIPWKIVETSMEVDRESAIMWRAPFFGYVQ